MGLRRRTSYYVKVPRNICFKGDKYRWNWSWDDINKGDLSFSKYFFEFIWIVIECLWMLVLKWKSLYYAIYICYPYLSHSCSLMKKRCSFYLFFRRSLYLWTIPRNVKPEVFCIGFFLFFFLFFFLTDLSGNLELEL